MRNHKQSNGIMEDFCDSPKAKAHSLFSIHSTALQILLYFDECELCNPLGSFRKKHKLGEKIFIHILCMYVYVRMHIYVCMLAFMYIYQLCMHAYI